MQDENERNEMADDEQDEDEQEDEDAESEEEQADAEDEGVAEVQAESAAPAPEATEATDEARERGFLIPAAWAPIAKIACRDETRRHIHCVALEAVEMPEQAWSRASATDGHCLLQIEGPVLGVGSFPAEMVQSGPMRAFIPAPQMADAAKSAGSNGRRFGASNIAVVQNGQPMPIIRTVALSGAKAEWPCCDVNFPPVEQVYPTSEVKAVIHLDAQLLAHFLDVVASLTGKSKRRGAMVKMEIREELDGVVVTATGQDGEFIRGIVMPMRA